MKIKIVDNVVLKLTLLAGLCGLNGCVEFKMPATMPWTKTAAKPKSDGDKSADLAESEESEEGEEPLPPPSVPDRLSVVWSDTVLHQHNKPDERGFGGRILFYSPKPLGDDTPAEPIVVDGTLTVYAFGDEQGRGAGTKPEKRFVFLPEQLKKHHSKSELGHSYSVWLPWDEVGGPQRRISLFVRFEPVQGGSVMSDAARKLLPGLPPDTQVATTAAKPAPTEMPIQRTAAQTVTTPEIVQAGGPVEPLGRRLQNYIDTRRQQLHGIQPAAGDVPRRAPIDRYDSAGSIGPRARKDNYGAIASGPGSGGSGGAFKAVFTVRLFCTRSIPGSKLASGEAH